MPNRKIFSLILPALLGTISAQAQTCQSDIPASTPTARFTVTGDGTVSDIATGLMWKSCAEGMSWDGSTCIGSESSFVWDGALLQAAMINGTTGGYAGKTDWRVPNVKELRSITERQCANPAINLSVFPGASSSGFWSGSPASGNSNNAWNVNFNNGNDNWNNRNNSFALRLVRAG